MPELEGRTNIFRVHSIGSTSGEKDIWYELLARLGYIKFSATPKYMTYI